MAWFDEEGGWFTFVITPYSLFIIEERDKPILYDLSEMKIEDLEKELISDIENDLNAWADFMDSDNFENNRQYIKQYIRKLKILGKEYESKNEKENPYPKYSYNTGLITTDNKPVYGIDNKWLMFEIKNGNGLPKI